MKTIKQILTLLLALTLVLGMAVPAYAATAASGTCGENVTWTLDSEGTLTISGTGAMKDYASQYALPWYSNCAYIKSILIEEGVTSIGNYAFVYCSSLTSVTIPESVTSIGSYAFLSCGDLTSITIPDSVTSIGENAFFFCHSLTSITIPDSVTSIGRTAFGSCSSLEGIWVDQNNMYYSSDDRGVLFNKDKTTLIAAPGEISGAYVIPQSVTSIGENAFFSCGDLTSITIPDGVTSINMSVFEGCNSLTSVTIPEGVTSIGYYAFSYCRSLTSVTIPESVTSIGSYAFIGCSSLTSVTIPEGVTSIYYSTFSQCSSLTSITLPDTLTSIGDFAFNGCSSLTSVTIPEGVTSIKNRAFYSCNKLSEITFQGDAPSIANNAFLAVTATAYYPADKATWTEDVRQNYGGNLTWVGYTKANPYKITNVVSGIHVYWKAVSGTAKYGLWRSETGINGTYKWVANPTVPHFTDTKVASGKTYYYKVTTMDSKGNHSIKSDVIGITYVSTPDISARYNKAAGVKLEWQKVTGATGYAIYRKSYSGNDTWVRVATISGNSTFTWTDTSVKNNNGTAYKYTIRALAGSDMKTLSGCRNAGRSMVRLTSRTLTGAAKASATSIKCSWNTSAAVTGYEVRFIVDGVVYKTVTVGDYKVGTKTFTGLKAGQTYKIQVRSYKKIDGMGFYSAWSTAKNVTL